MKEKKEFYSIPELAKLMHISRIAVFKKVQKGDIKAKKIGKAYAVSASEADGFIAHEEPAMYGEVALFKPEEGGFELEVKLKKENVWLNLNQISELFGRDKSVISRHIANIFEEGELNKKATVANFATVQNEGGKDVERQIEHYNLDVIISTGYRVKSQAGIQFRIWATGVLKSHVQKGYSLNTTRLEQSEKNLADLKQAISFIAEKSVEGRLAGREAEVLALLGSYADTMTVLLQYDEKTIKEGKGKKKAVVLTYEECEEVIAAVRKELVDKKEAGDLFGMENKNRFRGIIGGINQTFDGSELYPTAESKAAHLMYFIIKDHPFNDGNKRLGSIFFVYYLSKNGILDRNGKRRINDAALAALALLVAESEPKEKDIMIKLIMNLTS
jgi:prophage maintenance system killer protein